MKLRGVHLTVAVGLVLLFAVVSLYLGGTSQTANPKSTSAPSRTAEPVESSRKESKSPEGPSATRPSKAVDAPDNYVMLPQEPSESMKPTRSAVAEGLVVGDLRFSCGYLEYDSLGEIWGSWEGSGSGAGGCRAIIEGSDELTEYTLTDAEQAIVDTEPEDFWNENTAQDRLEEFYTNCSLPGIYSSSLNRTGETVQNGFPLVKKLCPDHPRLDEIEAEVNQASGENAEREEGVRFDDGTYLVGDEIQPGTYFSTKLGNGCYWERTDANGNTIDNNFINSARRAEVTIRASDYSFHADRCGEWTAK